MNFMIQHFITKTLQSNGRVNIARVLKYMKQKGTEQERLC